MSILDQLPEVKAIVGWLFDKVPEEFAKDSRVYTWNQFIQKGKDLPNTEVDAAISNNRPGRCCTLIYTSGTTGQPKGVMLSHDNLIFGSTIMCEDLSSGIDQATNEFKYIPEDMKMVSYLPLSHIAGLCTDLMGNLLCGS